MSGMSNPLAGLTAAQIDELRAANNARNVIRRDADLTGFVPGLHQDGRSDGYDGRQDENGNFAE